MIQIQQEQLKSVEFVLNNKKCALFADPGFGKTPICLYIIDKLKKEKKIKSVLIVSTPKIISNQWPEQIKKFNLDLSISEFKKAKGKQFDIYTVSFGSLPWLHDHLLDYLKSNPNPFDFLIIDESSKIKDPKSKSYKAIFAMRSLFERVLLLTGTPFSQDLTGIWSQIQMIEPGLLGASNFKFMQKYFHKKFKKSYNWIPNSNAERDIRKKINHIVHNEFKKPKSELKIKTVNIKMNTNTREKYKKMASKDMFCDVDGVRIVAGNKAQASAKLRQICGGFVYDEDKKPYRIHDSKIETIKKIKTRPVLISYEFDEDYEILKSAFNLPRLGSGQKQADFDATKDAWNRGEIPMLAANPKSVAHGLDLQHACCTIIFYSIPLSVEGYLQFLRRIWRQGNPHSVVTLYNLCMSNSIDEESINKLFRKTETEKRFRSNFT